MTTPLHLLYLPLPSRRIAAFAKRHRALSGDQGYLVHGVLSAVFGEQAPKPFSIAGDTGERLSVYAYADRDLAALRKARDPFAPPDVDDLVDWEAAATKPMPTLPAGMRLAFSVRVCPTVRLGRTPAGGKRSGAELDAYLAALDKWEEADGTPDTKPDRDAVYLGWFRAALDRAGGVELESLRIATFRLEDLMRKSGTRGEPGRPSTQLNRHPAATMEGVLRVTEADAFTRLLARGVGRHRAFGFGMLMLRKAPC